MDRNAFQLSASQNQVIVKNKDDDHQLTNKYLWAIVEQQQQVQRLRVRQPRQKEEVVLLRWGDDDNDDYQAVHITLNDDCNGDDDQALTVTSIWLQVLFAQQQQQQTGI
uniref:Uncharacterized protein n=1 Tax=Glossina austeni TaxID=7395 RepID=A0A1A9UMM4_GLOAU